MARSKNCPCGTNQDLAICCLPFIDGRAFPETAEQLMRSRYTAYALGRIDYVMQTHAPRTSGGLDRNELQKWAADTEFLGLQVLLTEAGGAGDREGVVAFAARLRSDGRAWTMLERSRFERNGGRWVYLDGVIDNP